MTPSLIQTWPTNMQLLDKWMRTEQIAFGAAKGAKGGNSAQARGIAYHNRVYKLLRLNFVLLGKSDWKLLVEPWYKSTKMKMRSPDSVALRYDEEGNVTDALVIEVKMNWKDGRDEKLLMEYVPIVSQVYGVKAKPLLIVGNLRGCSVKPLHGLADMWKALSWRSGDPTPVSLVL